MIRKKKCHAAMLQCTQPGILVGAFVACFFDIERQFFILQLRISTVVFVNVAVPICVSLYVCMHVTNICSQFDAHAMRLCPCSEC